MNRPKSRFSPGRWLWICSMLPLVCQGESAARMWNEQCLAAIRRDFPAPTVHSRNLFHLSAAMYDAWAAYSPESVGVFHNEPAVAGDVETARREAVSYAAYRILHARYSPAVGGATTIAELDEEMAALGYPVEATTTLGPSPAAVGNRCAAAVLAASADDGSNEGGLYADTTGYAPVNPPLILANSGTGTLHHPNRWQPLAFDQAFTQNGQVASNVQIFVGAHWGHVTPFALSGPRTDGVYQKVDPGPPPYLGGERDAEFKADNVEVIAFSAALDPASAEMIDISPGTYGNNPLGGNGGGGHPLNPATGLPYQPNEVKLGDFGRVLAEFWADGPQSETPPGHWNVIANKVADTAGFEKRLHGTGPVVSDLEWDVKLYLALNSAVHDAAVAAWGVKAHYDYVRPITSIRHLGGLGQSSNPLGGSYHPNGLPLVPDLIEWVTPASNGAGQRHAGLTPGKIAIRAWLGEPDDPETEARGVGWMHAEDWKPYQKSTFVTPAFAGYVSGHSTFSRAAAEVLTAFTGSPWFPGGIGRHLVEAGGLEFEAGPSEAVELQWGTYYDAADQAGISRLYGGIHVAADDGPGRMIGSKVGLAAHAKATSYFDGSVLDEFRCRVQLEPNGRVIRWNCVPGYRYQVEWSDTLNDGDFRELTTPETYAGVEGSVIDSSPAGSRRFYRVVRLELLSP